MEVAASAACRWEEVIVGDLQDQSTDDFFSLYNLNQTAFDDIFKGTEYPEIIDDIYIKAYEGKSDGKGNLLAAASTLSGPFYADRVSELPIFGFFYIDPADIDDLTTSGRLENVILHGESHYSSRLSILLLSVSVSIFPKI